MHESIADDLVKTVTARAGRIRLGDPTAAATEMGPMSQEKILVGVTERVTEAIAAGAEVTVGGPDGQIPGRGWFYPPTVLDRVTNDMAVARNELFGPVLSVIRFRDEDEAVAIANDSPFGLAAGIWTNDLGRAHRMARDLDLKHGLGEHLPRHAVRHPLWWHQGIRLRPGKWDGRLRRVHSAQINLVRIERSPVGDPFVMR